jgi:hypothetical protein
VTQWEYAELQSSTGDQWGTGIEKQSLADVAQQLGAEGWELVGVYIAGDGSYFKRWRAIFKRPYVLATL